LRKRPPRPHRMLEGDGPPLSANVPVNDSQAEQGAALALVQSSWYAGLRTRRPAQSRAVARMMDYLRDRIPIVRAVPCGAK